MSNKRFNLVLIGDMNTGKSTYILRLIKGHFYTQYNPLTVYATTVFHLDMNTNYCGYSFDIWDTYGDEDIRRIKNYFSKKDACIAFYTRKSDHKKTDELVKKFVKKNPNAKLVIVWSKCDSPDEQDYVDTCKCLVGGTHYLKRGRDAKAYQISTKTGYQLWVPFEGLLRQLTEREDIKVI